ncbi:sigma-70 family RNA polymerase sigma factor [Lachnospiraceae bacterium OttesenSCG-928-D06]|nr:sigma-70 family RNA polymerase sigma factor [Lachnospiraceae bacterium OttesenSCG-928-D06]
MEVTSMTIADALNALPKKKRDVILLAYYQDMTDREIGKLMNLTQSTIHYHRRTALMKMGVVMEELS